MPATIRLIDLLPEAELHAPSPAHVGVQYITVGMETRLGLFQHPDSRVVLPPILLGRKAVLSLSCALKEVCWENVRSPVVFRVLVIHRKKEQVAFELPVDVRRPEGRAWHERTLDLSRWRGQRVRIALSTTAEDSAHCWAGWGTLELSHEVAQPQARRMVRDHRNVVFIVADSLSADFLGCYGNEAARTPHLDRLAEDGIQFMQARASSGASGASTASLFTGLLPPQHGVTNEWGTIRRRIATLPGHLRWMGYRTVFAPSESLLARTAFKLEADFDEILPCPGNPHQPGDTTVRSFARWLDQRPDSPFFAWVQLFDPNQTGAPPEPFRSMHYQGDPRSPERSFLPETVRHLRAVETLHRLEVALDHLERGDIDTDLAARLRDAPEAMMGRLESGPDLADHLLALGPDARRGMDVPAFAAWLAARSRELDRGRIDPEVIAWLRGLMPALLRVEEELTGWLRGVVDARYLAALKMGNVSHLDANVGLLMDALRERGLYEGSAIVFVSPHGEYRIRDGVLHHYHSLMIPMILKTSGRRGRVHGTMDGADLAPTLLEAMGLPPMEGIAGRSRWGNVLSGEPIPEHDSLGWEGYGAAVALARGPVVVQRSDSFLAGDHETQWRPGDRRLTTLAGEPVDDPSLMRSMEARLEALLGRDEGRRAA